MKVPALSVVDALRDVVKRLDEQPTKRGVRVALERQMDALLAELETP